MRAGHVDLVITDLVMPGQEGIETIQALRKEVPGIGIIAMSGAFGGQYLGTGAARPSSRNRSITPLIAVPLRLGVSSRRTHDKLAHNLVIGKARPETGVACWMARTA